MCGSTFNRMDALNENNFGQQPRARIMITLHADGRAEISGPIQDKILCFGLLEMAKAIVATHQVDAPQIVAPRINLG